MAKKSFQLNHAIRNNLKRTAEDVALSQTATTFMKLLKHKVAKDTGEHVRSIFVKKLRKGVYGIGSETPQAQIEEYGRKPWKYPPFDSLVGRTIRKLGKPGTATWTYKDQPSETKTAIYFVARKIATKGIEAKHTYSNLLQQHAKRLVKLYKIKLKKAKWIT